MKVATVVITQACCPNCEQIINITADTVDPNSNVKDDGYILRCVNCGAKSLLDVQIKPEKQKAISELKHERAVDALKAREREIETENKKKGVFKWHNKTNIS